MARGIESARIEQQEQSFHSQWRKLDDVRGSIPTVGKTEILVSTEGNFNQQLFGSRRKLWKLTLPIHNWHLYGIDKQLVAETFFDHPPQTLAQFQAWWDLTYFSTAFLPESIAKHALVAEYQKQTQGGNPDHLPAFNVHHLDVEEPSAAEDSSELRLKLEDGIGFPMDKATFVDSGSIYNDLLDYRSGRAGRAYIAEVDLPQGRVRFVFPITQGLPLGPSQGQFVDAMFPEKRGRFYDAFAALARATGGLESLDPKAISDHLLQSSGHESDVF